MFRAYAMPSSSVSASAASSARSPQTTPSALSRLSILSEACALYAFVSSGPRGSDSSSSIACRLAASASSFRPAPISADGTRAS